MPAQARATDTFQTGHACDTTSTIAKPASPDVIVNTLGAARVGDPSVSHDILVGLVCTPHVEYIAQGSPTVEINSKKAARVGDAIDAGKITSGSPNVITDSGISAPGILFPDLIDPETKFGSREHEREVIESVNDVPNSEVSEYGDGGINNGDGDYNTPNTDNEGTEGTGVPAIQSNDDANGRQPYVGDGLIFLSHTDPRIEPELGDKLVLLAKKLDKTLTITSAYRSLSYNKRVKGVKGSMHTLGYAVDIVQTGYTIRERQDFIRAAHDIGLTGIGVYNTFTHLDIGG